MGVVTLGATAATCATTGGGGGWTVAGGGLKPGLLGSGWIVLVVMNAYN